MEIKLEDVCKSIVQGPNNDKVPLQYEMLWHFLQQQLSSIQSASCACYILVCLNGPIWSCVISGCGCIW